MNLIMCFLQDCFSAQRGTDRVLAGGGGYLERKAKAMLYKFG